jgi:hypothetical protein
MACYIISYDLRKPGRNYDSLYAAIKSYGTWAHINESVWAVVTTTSAVQIRDYLRNHMDENDRIFIVKSGVEAAWRHARCRNEWLKEHL